VREQFPFELVERIGVRSAAILTRVGAAMARGGHRPATQVSPEWYY
jgi:hypothetical protein